MSDEPQNGSRFLTLESLERHLNDKITSAVANLTDKIEGVERFFTAENRAAKDAVSIAMTAAEKAAQKAEIAADERTKSITLRLDKMEHTLAAMGGVSRGVGLSATGVVQTISSLASLGAIVSVVVVLLKHGS
jgi:Tfp pilus assembly protein PilE